MRDSPGCGIESGDLLRGTAGTQKVAIMSTNDFQKCVYGIDILADEGTTDIPNLSQEGSNHCEVAHSATSTKHFAGSSVTLCLSKV